jgi:hypothetical protein
MPSIPWEELNKPRHLRKPEFRFVSSGESRPVTAAPAPRPAVKAKDSPSAELRPTHCTEKPPTSRPAKATRIPRPAVKAKDSSSAELRTAHRTENPATSLADEPKPLSKCDDNPVLNEQGAAFVLGVSADLLKKWRQRAQGPDYIQYGPGGLVRYDIKALLDFRDDYKIYLNSKRYPRRQPHSNA